MSKATLEFTLPEENEEYEIVMKAGAMHSALWDIRNFFVRHYKHIDPKSEAHSEEFDFCSDKFFEILREQGIEL